MKIFIENVPHNSIPIFRASFNYDPKRPRDNIIDFLVNLYRKAIDIRSTLVNSFLN